MLRAGRLSPMAVEVSTHRGGCLLLWIVAVPVGGQAQDPTDAGLSGLNA